MTRPPTKSTGAKPKGAAQPAAQPTRAGAAAGRPQRPQSSAAESEAPRDSTLRLFYALTLPRQVSTRLSETQRLLKGNWRSVRADQMHVTLAYLPAVPPERLGDLRRLGADLTRDLAPLDLRLRGTGYFPNEGSPRVWFVKVEEETGRLSELAAALRTGIADLGLTTDDLPFKAHVTLARKKGPAPRVPPQVFDLGWQATGAVLARSILRKTGPIYQTESTFRFRGTPQAVPSTVAEAIPSAPAPDDGPALAPLTGESS